jgi:pimeloyl-ACP methyl ester carboxylesterase
MRGNTLCPDWRLRNSYFVLHLRVNSSQVGISPPNVPVVVLLHGYPSAGFDFHALWDSLATHFRVIAPDLLGFGV